MKTVLSKAKEVLMPDETTYTPNQLKAVQSKPNASKYLNGVYHKIGTSYVLGPPTDSLDYPTWLEKAERQLKAGYKFY